MVQLQLWALQDIQPRPSNRPKRNSVYRNTILTGIPFLK